MQHQACRKEFMNDDSTGNQSHQHEEQPNRSEGSQGSVVTQQRKNRIGDEEAITHDLDLRCASLGPRCQAHGDFDNPIIPLDDLERKLGLDVESATQNGSVLYDTPVECAIPGQDVRHPHAEQSIQDV